MTFMGPFREGDEFYDTMIGKTVTVLNPEVGYGVVVEDENGLLHRTGLSPYDFVRCGRYQRKPPSGDP